jgi:spermidine synthase
MEKMFEVLDNPATPLGDLILRRRKLAELDHQVIYEVILNEEFLMSSLFHNAEVALADLGLAAAAPGPVDVVVGGLGLGYTARAVLKQSQVRCLKVIEFLEPVIRWHKTGLVPLGLELAGDDRCELVQGDFFALAAAPATGFDPARPGGLFHIILLDIDHTTEHWLNPRHASFYTAEGLATLAQHLHPGGIFAMWSDAPADAGFLERLETVFTQVWSKVIFFPNPLRGGESSATIYLATRDEREQKK